MKVLIVNEGVQPELIQIALELYNQKVDFRYITRSSIPSDAWYLPLAIKISGLLGFKHILEKRIVPLPSINFENHYLLRSFILRFIPRRLSLRATEKISRRFWRKVDNVLLSHLPKVLILNEGKSGLKIPGNLGIQIILILSTTTKRHQNEMRLADIAKSPDWANAYSPGLYSDEQVAIQEADFHSSYLIICPSNYVKETLPHSIRQKAFVAHLGFDSSIFKYSNFRRMRDNSDDPLKCIFIGQFTQRKGVGYLLEAFRTSNLPHGSTLLFVGLMPTGRRAILERKFPGVHFSRPLSRAQIKQLLDDSDLFILPSIVEGFALSAIEALATGIPVLITNNTLDFQIEHLKNGLVAEAGDKSSLIELLEFAANNPNKIKEIGITGAEHAQNYTWEKYRNAIKLIFAEKRLI